MNNKIVFKEKLACPSVTATINRSIWGCPVIWIWQIQMLDVNLFKYSKKLI